MQRITLRWATTCFAVVISMAALGCIEIQQLLGGSIPGTNPDNGSPTDPTANPPDGGGTGPTSVPSVRLQVSNPNPELNEEVLLTCVVQSGQEPNISFAFQPNDGRLFIGPPAGTATFIVEESDIGQTFSFTCTATNSRGTSAASNAQLITPT